MVHFRRVLVANRSEIAVRVMRTLREMGISPLALYSTPDRLAPHVQLSDAAAWIGEGPSRESYLCIDRVIEAALKLGAEAIHPGYGFLSENSDFAQACLDAGLVFIGPPPAAIRMMGSKTGARQCMQRAGVPIVPGTIVPLTGTREELLRVAEEIGYPLMLKAVAGGGGKGMRLVREPESLERSLQSAQSEARNAFGDDQVYMERAIEQPRHIEIQVLCDAHGHGVYYGERDCSIQRRHQKIVEEAPSIAVSEALRRQMGQVAVQGALSVGYVGAGTMEFLLDQSGQFYFLEMNTRLQVEHPVTEAIFGVDLVREQVRIAAGEPLGYGQEAIVARGHAVEVRVYAEDPAHNFMPSPGLIRELRLPQGPFVRSDCGVESGFCVPIFYDPMIAKIIAWDLTRAGAISRLQRALSEMVLQGIRHNIDYLMAILQSETFRSGQVHTGFIAEQGDALLKPREMGHEESDALVIAAALQRELQGEMSSVPAQNSPAAAASESMWLQLARRAALRGSL